VKVVVVMEEEATAAEAGVVAKEAVAKVED
jgi:hypothetical protein